MNAHNAFVVSAIGNMKALDGAYWDATLAQRLPGGAGSHYTQFASKEALETALLGADWEPVQHKAVAPGCTAYRTSIPGKIGVTTVQEILNGDFSSQRCWLLGNVCKIPLTLRDRKGTGQVSAEVDADELEPQELVCDYTYMIVGEEDGKTVSFTFHPGAPVPPSEISAEGRDGESITMEEASDLGIVTVKIVFG